MTERCTKKIERRKDSKGRVLKEGESERKNGSYEYRWRGKDGKRHSVYGKTLNELREKVQSLQKDISDGICVDARRLTINDMYCLWKQLKAGLKENTFQNYCYMYEQFVYEGFGEYILSDLKKSDVRIFYNNLIERQGLKISTVDTIHTVLHQVLEMAVEDQYIRSNPSDQALKELRRAKNSEIKKVKALTTEEQNLFLNYLEREEKYKYWLPIFTVMLGSGLRVGEVTGLRWEDIDFENNIINVTHTLVFFSQGKGNHCVYAINSPKTENGFREVPMIESVREAFLQEKRNQEERGLVCRAVIDGYTNFVFLNRFGDVLNYGVLNKALDRIIRDCNFYIIDSANNSSNLITVPKFSCHTLRHTFATRLCEADVNPKAIQTILGHSDISTTLNIYADATRNLKQKAITKLDDFLKEKN